jgi:hypothetical protein
MRKCVVAALLLLLTTAAQADLTFYGPDDRASFAADAAITIVETFDAVTPTDTALTSFTSQGVTYATAVAGGNVWVTGHPYTNFGVSVPDATVLTANRNEDFTLGITFDAAVTAVGFDTYLNQYGPVTIQIHNSEGWTSTILSHAYTEVGFFGVTSNSSIDRIRWTAIGGQTVNTGIDNVQIGCVVPVPAAVLLGMIGLSAAGVGLRKRV